MYLELWRVHNVRWLAVIKFLTNLTFYSTVIVAFQTQRGLNYTEMFWLESVLSAALFLFEVPTGVLADKFGHRRMLILGQGLFTASYVLFAVAHGFWLFALSSVLFGVGLACLSGCDSALLYESLPTGERERLGPPAFALLSAASSAGFFCGLAVGSFMGAGNPALPVLVNILPMALAWAASFRLRLAEGTTAGPTEALPATELLRKAGLLIRSQPAAVGLSLFGTLSFALINAIFWYNQPLFERAQIPVAWYGPITAGAVALQMLMALSAPWAARRLGPGAALAFSCLLPGAAYLASTLAGAPGLSVLLVALVIAGGAWRQPVLQDELNRGIPDGARATTLSSLSLLGTLAGLLLNPLIGWAGDLGLEVATVGMGLSLIAAGTLVPFLTTWNTRRRDLACSSPSRPFLP